MPKFDTKPIKEIVGKKTYEQLIIDSNETNSGEIKGVWDNYKSSLESKYIGSFNGLLAIMNRDANMQSLSKDKFRDVTPDGELVKEYEIKYQDLRAYAIKIENGKLVLLGGYKNNQKADFTAFRSLKKQYLESLKAKNLKK